jgi:hypothetical protein
VLLCVLIERRVRIKGRGRRTESTAHLFDCLCNGVEDEALEHAELFVELSVHTTFTRQV